MSFTYFDLYSVPRDNIAQGSDSEDVVGSQGSGHVTIGTSNASSCSSRSVNSTVTSEIAGAVVGNGSTTDFAVNQIRCVGKNKKKQPN